MKNKNLLIIGYSGHSYGCIEVAIKQEYSIVGYHDISEKFNNPYNLDYLGHEDNIDPNNKVFIATGDNTIRRKIYAVEQKKLGNYAERDARRRLF